MNILYLLLTTQYPASSVHLYAACMLCSFTLMAPVQELLVNPFCQVCIRVWYGRRIFHFFLLSLLPHYWIGIMLNTCSHGSLLVGKSLILAPNYLIRASSMKTSCLKHQLAPLWLAAAINHWTACGGCWETRIYLSWIKTINNFNFKTT